MGFALDSPQWSRLQSAAGRVLEKRESSGTRSLSEAEETFFLVWVADGEVSNGGMHAVCYNSTGDFLTSLPNAYRAVGAPKKAALFERLIRAFGENGPSSDHSKRLEQHERLSEETASAIDGLDDEYFALEEEIDELLYVWSKRLPDGGV